MGYEETGLEIVVNGNAEMSVSEGGESRRSATVWRWVPLVVLVAGLGLFFGAGLDRYLSFETLREHRQELAAFVEAHYGFAAVAYMLGYLVIVALSVPGGAVMSLLGGFLFGIAMGSVFTVVGATAGATALFLAARTTLGETLRARAGRAVQRMRAGFQANAFSYLLSLRLIPVLPFWLVNLVPALVGVPLRTYVAATAIGIVPGTVVYVSVGNGLGAIFEAGETPDLGLILKPEILLPLLGLAVLALLPAAYRHWRRRRQGG